MGPLSGIKVIELASFGPAQFCCMLLADMGADVIRVDRLQQPELALSREPQLQLLNRGRRSVAVDLTTRQGVELILQLLAKSDVLVEGFRPGVTERLGLGPNVCLEENQALIYGRVTGWGQSGPMAKAAGHDIDYIALSGALDAIGQEQGPPVVPLNLLGDFAGGGLYAAFGIVSALLEARASGKGQVVDASILDGTIHLMTSVFADLASGFWQTQRGTNVAAGAAPWYGIYPTKDEKFVAVGAVEGRFFNALLQALEIDPAEVRQHDRTQWPALRDRMAKAFSTRTRDEWDRLLGDTDTCVAPVLDVREVQHHRHVLARGVFANVAGIAQPAPTPRFSRSDAAVRFAPPTSGQHTAEILKDLGLSSEEIGQLRQRKVIG